jgi:hypothetical protein
MSDLSHRNYIRWDDPRVESIPPNEAETINAVAEQINAIQKVFYDKTRHCYAGICSLQILNDISNGKKELMLERTA